MVSDNSYCRIVSQVRSGSGVEQAEGRTLVEI